MTGVQTCALPICYSAPADICARALSTSGVITLRRNISCSHLHNQTPDYLVPALGFAKAARRNYRRSRILEKRDYYEALGVTKSATKAEIKKKYFELAKKFHPDVNKDDPKAAEKFQEVRDAYEVLQDDEKRRMYDSYGHAGVDQNGAAGGFGGFGGAGGFGEIGRAHV